MKFSMSTILRAWKVNSVVYQRAPVGVNTPVKQRDMPINSFSGTPGRYRQVDERMLRPQCGDVMKGGSWRRKLEEETRWSWFGFLSKTSPKRFTRGFFLNFLPQQVVPFRVNPKHIVSLHQSFPPVHSDECYTADISWFISLFDRSCCSVGSPAIFTASGSLTVQGLKAIWILY